MCYNISNNNKSEAQLQKVLGPSYPKKLGQLKIQFSASGFTHPEWPVIACEYPNEFQLLNWGLIPNWTPSIALAKQFAFNNLNCKSETIFDKASFSVAIKKQRCLVPVTGFFEWRSLNKNKYPYHIQLKHEEIFCLGGIYDNWVDKEAGEIKKTFSIVTTEANPLMAKIHNTKLRMPLILTKENRHHWLNSHLLEWDIKKLMQPLNDDLMTAYTISKRITSRTEDPNSVETLEPFEYPELALIDS